MNGKNKIEEPEEMDVQEETKEDKSDEKEEERSEVKDPQEMLRAHCRSECQRHADKLDEFNLRVLSKSETKEICFEELIELLHCVDHCVAHDLFKYLK